jgi:protein SCO1/2
MANRATRPLTVFAAFIGSLAIGLSAVLWLAGGGPFGGNLLGKTQPAKIGGPFQLTDQTGRSVTEKDLIGRPKCRKCCGRWARTPTASTPIS